MHDKHAPAASVNVDPRGTLDRVAVVLALVLVIAVNWLANALPLGGLQTGQVSALYESYFTPTGFTFGIWAVIYTGLLLYAIYQAFPGRVDGERLQRIGRLFMLNCLLNSAWLFAWHYQYLTLSMVLMLCVLATLVLTYRHLGQWGETRLLVRIPFTVYLAWICVATLANLSALQTSLQLNDAWLGHIQWTQAKIALAGAVGAIVCVRCRDAAFVLVVAWAAFGIASKQAAIPEVHGAALTVSLLCLLLAVITLVHVALGRAAVRSQGA